MRQEQEALANTKRQAEEEASARVLAIQQKREMWNSLGKELGLDGDSVIHTKVRPSYALLDHIYAHITVSHVLPVRRLARRAKALKARLAYPVLVSMGLALSVVSPLLPTPTRLHTIYIISSC